MNIVIFGAGAIGSLLGAFLSKNNTVTLIGRKAHVLTIKKNNLIIKVKTNLKIKINAEESVDNIKFKPNLLILTVKSFDTESAIKQAKKIIDKDTTVLSLQNGLDNIDKIKKYINYHKIIAGVTTHGAFFSKPGVIKHTGKGITILGEINGEKTKRLTNIINCFNKSGIETIFSKNIIKEIWYKTIINSSINPLTAIFNCKNGYLLKNPILETLVNKICKESSNIARANDIHISYKTALEKTKDVIRNTSENYSSMLQSIKKDGRTEIESINGKLVEIGKKYNLETLLNETLFYSIKSLVC
ncbi:MAG: 2-dehydropantoate 2-reductase [Candidatus Thermoplasmatota archaeon]|jgi:2-dehydropantoate 2-reductase|nr:2-dehydropantoate 2-reductase [Candidatus Thermoplasmatota archaeon]